MRTAPVQNAAICIVRKPAKSGPHRSGKALADKLLAAAAACGLSRRQAADLLAETMAVGIAVALSPERKEAILKDLQRKTAGLVLATRGRHHQARRAA